MKTITPRLREDSAILLFEGSLKSIPFNVLLAVLLAVSLYYNHAPGFLIFTWLSAVVVISLLRWLYSHHVMKKGYQPDYINLQIYMFLFMTLITGAVWNSCYFIFTSHVNGLHEAIIILVLGGMSAGAIASLSVYIPAYCAYLLPMFLPIIVYNFWQMELDRGILASMYLLFVVMLIISAKINARLLHQTFELSDEKGRLIEELTISNQKLEQSLEEIKVMSITDSLTGLYNRRYFDGTLRNEMSRAKRNEHTINLIMIDIDNFKYINDTYGHPYGDTFLIYVANSIKKAIRRTTDTVFRLGGDEFAAILPNISQADSVELCNKIQKTFQKNNKHDNVSLSMSVVTISSSYASAVEHIISTADRALYQAKEGGKNQIISKCLPIQ